MTDNSTLLPSRWEIVANKRKLSSHTSSSSSIAQTDSEPSCTRDTDDDVATPSQTHCQPQPQPQTDAATQVRSDVKFGQVSTQDTSISTKQVCQPQIIPNNCIDTRSESTDCESRKRKRACVTTCSDRPLRVSESSLIVKHSDTYSSLDSVADPNKDLISAHPVKRNCVENTSTFVDASEPDHDQSAAYAATTTATTTTTTAAAAATTTPTMTATAPLASISDAKLIAESILSPIAGISDSDTYAATYDIADNYVRGVLWSPDSYCVLVNTASNVMQLMEINATADHNATLRTALTVPASGPIYDYAWFPTMDYRNPETCCFAMTSRGRPIQLFDAFSAKLRAAYTVYDQFDEPTSAISVYFDKNGKKLYAGLNKRICIFDVSRPGRECESRELVQRVNINGRSQKLGQFGYVSCIDISEMTGTYAAGSYSGHIYLYDKADGQAIGYLPEKCSTGVSQLKFSPDGRYLFASNRKRDDIVCYDVRNTCDVVARFKRPARSNQRISFDLSPIHGRYLMTGGQDGQLRMFDTYASPDSKTQRIDPMYTTTISETCVNSVSFHPFFSSSLPYVATGTGRRTFTNTYDTSSSDEADADADTGLGVDAGIDVAADSGAAADAKNWNCVQAWKLVQ
jgi:telomerase Cajal body protein 1